MLTGHNVNTFMKNNGVFARNIKSQSSVITNFWRDNTLQHTVILNHTRREVRQNADQSADRLNQRVAQIQQD
jgi:hypothetical protein